MGNFSIHHIKRIQLNKTEKVADNLFCRTLTFIDGNNRIFEIDIFSTEKLKLIDHD